MIRKPKATQRLKRGIPLLPSLFTSEMLEGVVIAI